MTLESVFIGLTLAFGAPAMAQDVASVENAVSAPSWETVLGRYVKAPDGQGLARFDYQGLKNNLQDIQLLKDFIRAQEGIDPDTLNDAEAVVYWANLYNAVTVKLIVDNYPIKSIRELKSGLISIGPWGRKLVTVNGKELTLNNIEHDIMRKKHASPLIHYMVNCASIGCPNLKNGLWQARTLEADREKAARNYINSPRGVKVTDKGLVVSSIYKWFKEDFGGNEAGVLKHIREYADDDLAALIDGGAKIKAYEYDWQLNETKS